MRIAVTLYDAGTVSGSLGNLHIDAVPPVNPVWNAIQAHPPVKLGALVRENQT